MMSPKKSLRSSIFNGRPCVISRASKKKMKLFKHIQHIKRQPLLISLKLQSRQWPLHFRNITTRNYVKEYIYEQNGYLGYL